MNAYKRILIPTDFSEYSHKAAALASLLAAKLNSEVTVFHSIEFLTLPYHATLGLNVSPDPEYILARLHESEQLKRFLELFTSLPKEPNVILRLGDPRDTILEVISEEKVDLVIMGTHGYKGFDELVLGSVTAKVIKRSPVPVIALHELRGESPSLSKVVIPLDFSDRDLHAFRALAPIARTFQPEVHLIHLPEPDRRDVDDLLRARADRFIEVTGTKVKVRTSKLGGEKPYLEIVQYAHNLEADLIVMAPRLIGFLRRLVIGSTTMQVVRLADCPVMVVPPERR